jgi:hypothetical protein
MDDLIFALDLFDVTPSKGIFTWNNRRVGPGFISTMMDHFLINNSFLFIDSFSSKIIPWTNSAHQPISLLFEKAPNWGPSPFHFNPIWLDNGDFLPLITRSWNQWIIGSLVFI